LWLSEQKLALIHGHWMVIKYIFRNTYFGEHNVFPQQNLFVWLPLETVPLSINNHYPSWNLKVVQNILETKSKLTKWKYTDAWHEDFQWREQSWCLFCLSVQNCMMVRTLIRTLYQNQLLFLPPGNDVKNIMVWFAPIVWNGDHFDGEKWILWYWLLAPLILKVEYSQWHWINTCKCLAQNLKSWMFTKWMFYQAFKQNKSWFRHNKEKHKVKCKTIQHELP
jgi:hypothetical protein